MTEPQIRAFLIADIRGYTAFTEGRGDEAAAELTAAFARLTREGVSAHAGEVIELRGDEALAVFASARQAMRAAVDLQERYAAFTSENPQLALDVGIGLDAGEAVPVEEGYRGSALNVAARLCSAAAAGQIIATETMSHLAGKLDGIEYASERLRVKGVADRIRAVRLVPEGSAPALASPAVIDREPTVPATFPEGLERLIGDDAVSKFNTAMDLARQAEKLNLPEQPAGRAWLPPPEPDHSLGEMVFAAVALAIIVAGIVLAIHFH